MAQPDALTDGPRHWWHFLTNPVELAYGSHSSYLSTSMPVRDSRQLVALMASFGAVGHSAWSIFAKKDNDGGHYKES